MSIFTKVKAPTIKRSVFNLSEEAKISCNFGDLIPICCKEVIPSDHFRISTELLIKLAPLAAPVMHRINAYVHYFFVPTYQICDAFADFINPKVNTASNPIILPWDSPSYLNSQVSGVFDKGSLSDYLGLPILQTNWKVSSGYNNGISLLPFAAYQHIYNEYYRDQNLETPPVDISEFKQVTTIGAETKTWFNELFKLRRRAWAKDYFTSALPSPQAGDDVLIPISSTVNIESDGSMDFNLNPTGVLPATGDTQLLGTTIQQGFPLCDSDGRPLKYNSGLKGTASNSTATINDLRKAMALQRFKELAERGGTRYSEVVRNFFGAFLPDWYIDRPIFLGGQRVPIQIGEVVQTSQDSESAFLGERAGIGNGYGKTKTANLKSPCHGFLIGILSIRPQATYQQGLERMWFRKSLYDFPFPQFANLGEQEIYNKEIYAGGGNDNGVFGYTPRYAEYKEGHCHVCGEFRDTLKDWHFGRIFSNAPALNKTFVQMDQIRYDPFKVTAEQTEHVYVNLYNNIVAKRPLPYYGTPSIL